MVMGSKAGIGEMMTMIIKCNYIHTHKKIEEEIYINKPNKRNNSFSKMFLKSRYE